jgi:putative methyltransferase (TIGR01177 family)
VPPPRSLEGFVSGLGLAPLGWPSLLFWLWGPDHGLAHAEVEALTGHPAYSLARGLLASPARDRRPLARLAFTRAVLACLGRSDDLVPPFEPRHLITGTFAVRAHVLEGVGAAGPVEPPALGAGDVARRAGALICRRLPRPCVDLGRPDTEVHVFVTPSGVYWGAPAVVVDGDQFAAREPHTRPFWRSIALPQRKARCLVNLSGVGPGGLLLDPFCGTGSIPIEAALMGIRSVASDVDPVVASGAACNVAALGLAEIQVCRMDARAWGDASLRFDAIVADLPYGRSASIKGVDRDELYATFLETAARLLKPGARAVLMAPEGTLPASPSGLDVRGRYSEYVHGSLTREVTVLEKAGRASRPHAGT